MTAVQIAVEPRPSRADRNTISRGLGAYNLAEYGRLRSAERWIFARDPAGTVQGGAKCAVAYGWLYIHWLWVAESCRRQSLGTRLLAAAAALGREQNCLGLHLHTWSFQAPGFYRKQGFAEAGQAADMPPGATRFWFVKRF